MAYYSGKIAALQDIFGTRDVRLEGERLLVDGHAYPVINDVIVLAAPAQYTATVKKHTESACDSAAAGAAAQFAEDIQFTFGEEWKKYDKILPEHEGEFRRYFDIVDISSLAGKRVCDLGCGMGRWSYFLKDRCKELVLIDFSDAIFAARENLKRADNCLFFMGDLKKLPFRDDFADFLFSLGVLHHLPTPCLDAVRALRRKAPELLIFLYYALDNRPFYFRWLLKAVTAVRNLVSRVRAPRFRKLFSLAGTYGVYMPLILLGRLLAPAGLSRCVPLYEFYHDKSARRIEQDVYDRFFTRIEQRVSRNDIIALKDTFARITVSDRIPYWHFLCRR